MWKRFFVASCLVGLAGAAGADVRYTTKNKVPNSPVESRISTFVKGKRQRVETVTDMGQIKINTVALTLCDKHENIQLDTELKIYTSTPMGGGSDAKSDGATGKGEMISTYTVKDMGKEKIANLDAHHWMVSTHQKGSGCVGTVDTTMKSEVWVAPVQTLNCPESGAYAQPNCKVTMVEKGDVKLMRAAYRGMIVKMITYMGEQKVSEQEFVDYSTAALADSLFAVPADYKKVTQAEFQQQQQQKMMKAYQH